MLQARTGTQEKLLKLQHDSFACDLNSEKNLCEFLVYDVQLIQKFAIPGIQALLLLSLLQIYKYTFLVLVEIKS